MSFQIAAIMCHTYGVQPSLKLHIDRAKMSLHDEKATIYLQKPPMPHKTLANTITTIDQSELDTSETC